MKKQYRHLYLDFETDIDEELADRWSLPPIIPIDQMPDIKELLKGSVADVSASLKAYNEMALSPDWLASMWDAETASKDRAGVLKVISSAQGARDNYIRRIPLDPQLCSVVSAGIAVDDNAVEVLLRGDTYNEAHILRIVWDYINATDYIVGWKVINFDLRVLLMRSIQNSVRPTRSLDLRKWGNTHALDLKIALWGNDVNVKGLKETARHFGIDIPAGDMDGSMVWSYTPEQLIEYQESDVLITRAIHRRVAGYLESVPPISYLDDEVPF